MSSGPKTIGILGGMGPLASAHFLSLVTDRLNRQGCVADHEYPRIIFISLPLQQWGIGGAVDVESVRGQVLGALRWLVEAGAERIAIPCNSVHEFFEGFPDECVSIVASTVTLLPSGSKVKVLCSEQTERAGLYEREDITVSYGERKQVNGWIEAVLRGERPDITSAVRAAVAEGADAIILGCTELSVCHSDLPTIDSSVCLADALVLV